MEERLTLSERLAGQPHPKDARSGITVRPTEPRAQEITRSMATRARTRLRDNVALVRSRWKVLKEAARHEDSRNLLLEVQAMADQERQQLRAIDPEDDDVQLRELILMLARAIAGADSLRLRRMYLDGGESWRRFSEGFENILTELEQVVGLLNTWIEGPARPAG